MAYRKFLFCVFVMVLFFKNILAQTPVPEIINQQIETLAEQGDENADLTELQEQQELLLENPIDLNHSSGDELISCGLFDEFQANALIAHIQKCGGLLQLEELQTIDGFDQKFILSLLPFVRINGSFIDPRLAIKNLIADGKSQLTVRIQQILEAQKGFQFNEEGTKPYTGTPLRIFTKYRFTAGKYFSMGFTCEKDPGENFFAKENKNGFDFYSFHISVKPGKFVKSITLGDYQVQFGQGLVAWSGLAFGKSADVMSVKKQAQGFRAYTSANETSFLRGIAAEINFHQLSVNYWISYRKLDANIVAMDTSVFSEFGISSVGMSGYHRTAAEIADKHVLSQFISGTNIRFKKRNFSVEYTAEFAKYNLAVTKGNNAYELFDATGKDFFNNGIAYSFQLRNFTFFGEAAMDRNKNLAVVNGVLLMADKTVSFSLVHRNYSKKYTGINANPFGESGKAQNEKGIYAGIQIQLLRTLKATGYIDFFSFPWLRYQVDAPSNGSEILTQFTYTPSRSTEIYFRFKTKQREEDDDMHLFTIDEQQHVSKINLRWNIRFKMNADIILQSRVEAVIVKKERNRTTNGTLFMQELQYKPMGKSWSMSCCYLLFCTDDYDSRVYTYQQDLPGAYSIPGYFYSGSSYYILMRFRIYKNVDAWCRFSRTNYDHLSSIGSGNEAIGKPHKSELKVQFRYSF